MNDDRETATTPETDGTTPETTATVDEWDGVHSDRVHLVATDVTPEQIAKTLGVELSSPVPDTAPAKAEPVVATETATAEVTPEAKAEADGAPAPKASPKVKSPSARIAQAQFDLREAERRARAATDRARDLEAQLAAATAAPAPANAPTPETVPASFPTWDVWAAMPAHEGQTYEDYADERGDWRAAQLGLVTREEVERLAEEKARALRETERQEAAATAEEKAAAARHLAFLTGREEAKRLHEDYVDVVEQSDLPTNDVMNEFVLRSGDRSGELMYYLGTHPEDCQRIAALPTAAEVIKAMTRIELTLEAATPAGPAASVVPMTRAPAPPEPVGGARHSSVAPSLSDPRLSLKDFMRIRNEQEYARAAQS